MLQTKSAKKNRRANHGEKKDDVYDELEFFGDVEKLVAKYGEDKLLAMVRKKYRVKRASSTPQKAAPPATPLGLGGGLLR